MPANLTLHDVVQYFSIYPPHIFYCGNFTTSITNSVK